MSYYAPREDEMLYCTRDGVPLYKSASTLSEKLKTNSKHNDHSLRDYQEGEEIGTVVSRDTYPGADGNLFLKVQYWTWEREGDNIFGFRIFGDPNVQKFHEGYLNIKDEPEGWIRESWRAANTENAEQEDKSAEITTYLKQFPGVPAPTSVAKRTDATGRETWVIGFANGYTVDYEQFVKIPAADKLTLTTRDPSKSNSTATTNNKGGSTSTVPSLFTKTNILFGFGILLLLGIVVFVLTKRKR